MYSIYIKVKSTLKENAKFPTPLGVSPFLTFRIWESGENPTTFNVLLMSGNTAPLFLVAHRRFVFSFKSEMRFSHGTVPGCWEHHVQA